MTVRSLKRLKSLYFKRLNDIHITSQITRSALASYSVAAPSQIAGTSYRRFQVPSGGQPTARIRRQMDDVAAIIRSARDRGEPEKALVLAVAVTEDFLLNAIKLVLRAYPERLMRGFKGGEAKVSIDFEAFLTRDRHDIIEEQIASRLQQAFYAGPTGYLQFMSQALEMDMPELGVADYLEIKASRDVIVHGNGVADRTYVHKAGPLARAKTGAPLPIDETYFDSAIRTLKSMIGAIGDSLATRYAGDARVEAEIPRVFASSV